MAIVEAYIDAVQRVFGNEAEKTLERLAQSGQRFFTGAAWANSREQEAIITKVSPYLPKHRGTYTPGFSRESGRKRFSDEQSQSLSLMKRPKR